MYSALIATLTTINLQPYQKHVKMQFVCMSLFIKGVQNVHHLHGHMPGDAFSAGQLQCR